MSSSDVQPEWVLHLAAHGGYSWQTDAAAILRANVVGTANLLAACRQYGVETFVNTGSSSEYGLKDHPPCEEESIEPNSIYATAKAAATMLCQQAAVSDGMNISTLRLYSTYGPWEDPHRLIPALAVEGLRGTFPPLVAPDTARDFVWIGDVVDAYLLAARAGIRSPARFTTSGPAYRRPSERRPRSPATSSTSMQAPAGDRCRLGSWDTDRWIADSTKIRERLGWRPTRSFREGFTELAAWLRARPDVLSHYWHSRG